MAFYSLKAILERFVLRHYPTPSNETVIKRKRMYILPTSAGMLFSVILFIMLLGSMNYNNSMGYVLTFWLGSMLMVSLLHTHNNLVDLHVKAGKSTPVFAGDTAQFQLWLGNYNHPARYALVCERYTLKEHWSDFFSLTKELPMTNPLYVDVPADSSISVMLAVPHTQRGRISLGRLRLSTRFPVSLFWTWSYVRLDISTIVYPKPDGNRNLPSGQETELSGESKPRDGGGEDFMGYRDYKVGDSPRHIDWKAAARERGLLVKQFGGLGSTNVWLTWNDVSGLNSVERALSQLCLWVLVADSQGKQYGLRLPNCTIEPDTGEAHRERCLRALALFDSD